MNEYARIVATIFLIAVTALFVAAEYAIIRVRRTRVEEMVDQKLSGAKAIEQSLRRLDIYLSGTQLGVTMASLGLGWIGQPAMARLLIPIFHLLPLHSETLKETIATVIAFALITFIAVVFGELLPKWAAIQRTERSAQLLAAPMLLFIRLFYPLIWSLEHSAGLFARWIGLNPAMVGAHEASHSEDEILTIIEAAGRSGTLQQGEAEILRNVFEFAHTPAKKVMTPRVNMVTLSTTWSIAKNVEIAIENGFTRFPLVEGDADHVVGMVHIKDLLAQARIPGASIRGIVREILKIPETKPIDELLRELQKSHVHQSIVMDEYGGTAGLVTIEDVLEELVGEIQDEYDRPPPIEQINENEYLVAPWVPISDVVDELGLVFPEDTEFETVGGYALHELGLTPTSMHAARLGEYELRVSEVRGNRIQRLSFIRREPEVDVHDISPSD